MLRRDGIVVLFVSLGGRHDVAHRPRHPAVQVMVPVAHVERHSPDHVSLGHLVGMGPRPSGASGVQHLLGALGSKVVIISYKVLVLLFHLVVELVRPR